MDIDLADAADLVSAVPSELVENGLKSKILI